jgi:NTE family protein
MSAVGLVLGGGGVTGAAYEMAALMAIELATGWNPNLAEVVVGTSAGAYVTALVRNDRLDLDSLVLPTDDREAVAERITERLFTRRPGVRIASWLRHGILPGVRSPGLTLLLGSPAPYDASGLRDWVIEQVGTAATGWPAAPTVIVAYDIVSRKRVAFGTVESPDVNLADAVAASSSIPVVFRPYMLNGSTYVDGGVVSGTHADLVLGRPRPLDLVLVLAPLAAEEERAGAWFHEKMFDRVGRRSLGQELSAVRKAWPDCEILVLRPSRFVLAAMRPNPMDAKAAVPTFVRTLASMKRTLAGLDIWPVLSRHLREGRRRAAAGPA